MHWSKRIPGTYTTTIRATKIKKGKKREKIFTYSYISFFLFFPSTFDIKNKYISKLLTIHTCPLLHPHANLRLAHVPCIMLFVSICKRRYK